MPSAFLPNPASLDFRYARNVKQTTTLQSDFITFPYTFIHLKVLKIKGFKEMVNFDTF